MITKNSIITFSGDFMWMVYLVIIPFGLKGRVHATKMLSDVITSALIWSGGPGTDRKHYNQINENNLDFIKLKYS